MTVFVSTPLEPNKPAIPNVSSGWPGFLDKQTAAEWASVSVRTLDRWIQRGLPIYRSGPRTKPLLRRIDIEQWLNRQQRPRPDLGRMIDQVMDSLTKTTSEKQLGIDLTIKRPRPARTGRGVKKGPYDEREITTIKLSTQQPISPGLHGPHAKTGGCSGAPL